MSDEKERWSLYGIGDAPWKVRIFRLLSELLGVEIRVETRCNRMQGSDDPRKGPWDDGHARVMFKVFGDSLVEARPFLYVRTASDRKDKRSLRVAIQKDLIGRV